MKFFVWLALILMSCQQDVKVVKSFYFWQNKVLLENQEIAVIHQIKPQIVYLKCFELKFEDGKGAVPHVVTQLKLDSNSRQLSNVSIDFIPVVFIENQVFKKIKSNDFDPLIDKFIAFTKTLYNQKIAIKNQFKEIQIDCDWTEQTKENYFIFLEKLKNKLNVKISCTLRLYPYKYPNKMGVPPVNSVMLMCYNLINPRDDDNRNTIFDAEEFEQYLKGVKNYPLKMDIALPVFSWFQHFKDNQFLGFFEILEHQNSIKLLNNLTYLVQEDFTENNHFFKQGDLLKKESVTSVDVFKAIDLIKKNIKLDKEIRVSLFHLNPNLTHYYSIDEIHSFYSRFNN